jgi:MinD superfamily P-loop ATPase
MAPNIYWVGGGKGGVGKSMVSMALLDYLLSKGVPALLVESDTSNPDVYKASPAPGRRYQATLRPRLSRPTGKRQTP